MTNETRTKEEWVERKGDKRQTRMNRFGAAGMAVMVLIGGYTYTDFHSQFRDMKDSIRVSRMNKEDIEEEKNRLTRMISEVKEKLSGAMGILHDRVEQNENKIENLSMLLHRVDERSDRNREELMILRLK